MRELIDSIHSDKEYFPMLKKALVGMWKESFNIFADSNQ